MLPDVWRMAANVIRETSRRVLSVSSEKKVAKERPQKPVTWMPR